jgi:hypothetical protein
MSSQWDQMHLHFALKLVSVPFAALGLPLPTFSLTFCTSVNAVFHSGLGLYSDLEVLLFLFLLLGA